MKEAKNIQDRKWVEEYKQRVTAPIRDWDFAKIAIAIPLERGMVNADKVVPFIAHLGQRGAHFLWHPYARTDIVRNHAVLAMLNAEQQFTHILFLDSDHNHYPNVVERLARWVAWDPTVEVVSGINFQRVPPFKTCWYMANDEGKLVIPTEWPHGLVEAAAVGGGSLLVSRKVFEKIPPVWFQYFYDDALGDIYPGEDIYFSMLCRENGVKMWVDTTTCSPHYSVMEVTEELFRGWYDKYGLDSEDTAGEKLLAGRERSEFGEGS